MKILVLLVLALIVSLSWANLDAGDLVLYERTGMSSSTSPNLAANEDPSANTVVLLVTASGGIFGVDSRNGAILWGFNSGRKLFSSSLASIVPGLDGMLYYATPDGLKANPFSVQEIAERSPLYVGDETIYIASKSTSLLRILPLTGQIVLPSSLPSNDQEVIVLGRTDYLVRAIDRRTNRQIWNVTLSRFTRQGYCSSNGKPTIEQKADESSDHSGLILSSLNGKVEMLHVYHSQQRDAGSDNETAFRLDLSEDELAVDDENDRVTRLTRAWELYFDSPIAYVFSTGSTSSSSFPGGRLGGSDEISLFYQEQFVSCASNVIFIGELANSFYALPRLHFRATGSNARNTNDANFSASRQLIPYTPPANDYVTFQYVDYEWFKLLQTLLVTQPELVLTSCTDDSFDFPYCMLGPQLLVQEGVNETDFGDNETKNTTDPVSELRESSYLRFKIRIAFFVILVIGLLALLIGAFAKESVGLGMKSETAVSQSAELAPSQNSTPDVEQIAEKLDEPVDLTEEPDGKKQAVIEDLAPEVVAEAKQDEPIDGQSGSADDAIIAAPTPTKPQRVGDILTIGKIEVNLSQVLGYGSSGTVVFEGKFQDRRVAVKRIMNYFYHIAQREMEILLHSDDHPSIIRYFAKEQDDEFIYLALAVCSTTLDQYILSPAFKTVDASVLSRILLEISLGVAHLHRLNIVHRDLKPQNVLLDNLLRAKISDMGLAKRLAREELSFSTDTKGTAGWQPHEVVTDVSVRRTKSVDIFSLGCIIYYVLTSLHPFGSRFEHQHNIVHDKPNLEKLSDPLALDLVQNMIRYIPNERLSITDVCNHIYFWNTETKLEFLKDLSDRLEFEDMNHALVVRFEELAVQRKILGPKMDWSVSLGKALLEDLKKFRQYKPSKLRPLLRVIRNKANHHFDLPLPLREEFGNFPEGYLNYYQSRFPLLLPFCYMFFRTECTGEQQLNEKYLKYK